MKNKTRQPTLSQILKVVNQGFTLNDKRFTSIERQLINLLGETTYTRNEASSFRAEMGAKIGSLESTTITLKSEMNQRFDEVDDKLQNLFKEVDIATDQKLEKFRQRYLAA